MSWDIGTLRLKSFKCCLDVSNYKISHSLLPFFTRQKTLDSDGARGRAGVDQLVGPGETLTARQRQRDQQRQRAQPGHAT